MRRNNEIQADLDRVMDQRNRLRELVEDLAVIYPVIRRTPPYPEIVRNGYLMNSFESDYPWRAEDIARLAAAIRSETDKGAIDKLRKEFRG